MKDKITKEMTIGEVMQKHPGASELLFKEGLMCVMCGMAQHETIEQGAISHGIDVEKLVKTLNKALK